MITREELESKIITIENNLEDLRKVFKSLENEYTNFKFAYHIVEDELKTYKKMLKDYENF